MTLPWNYKEILLNFLRENTNVLSLSFLHKDLLLKLNHNPNLITVVSNESNLIYEKLGVYIVENVDCLKNEQFNIVLARFAEYNVNKISSLLKKGGHVLIEQKGYEKSIDFNLENQTDLLKKAGFKIVKANQVFIENENYFYILAKNGG